MKLRYIILGFLFLIIINLPASNRSYQYLLPIPESNLNSINSEIIMRHGEIHGAKTITNNFITLIRDIRGFHEGTPVMYDEGKISAFKSKKSFKPDETVAVNTNSGVKTLSSEELEPFSFRFFVSLLLVPLNCDDLSNENENWNIDFSPEIFYTMVNSLYKI
ncbi:MAG: hypothetical protein A2X61_16005 [Ignavibacteria bacterium GWB2_35_12]|nr:MAG: hypothetical protein A2X63_07190 [Ignavibacteria bacterium GWA2_35_8]OGU40876.1 MAG: hypothetical protein A2X61_16005 [Ignavibacteria bacterium GWB2_35_12]OGU87709.1 MAG: hypothetical protein A2220_11650 [Ignavibacteria bacterium RIFOXYA2_FULL_35_10]OGV20142.1 MAG: hypothetical protein A2475_14785 [Ignavibacteria bacterium RIFOXYC2_FULL_35_21]